MNTTLHSIGYGNRPIREFIDLLLRYHITYLADVRTKPWSRQFEDYRKKELTAHLKAAGIRYVFMGDGLGGMPDDPLLRTFDGKVDHEAIRRSEPYREGLSRLRIAHGKDVRLAMMCAELRPEKCHRAKLIGESLLEQGIDVSHIDHDGELRSQSQVRDRWMGGQELELF